MKYILSNLKFFGSVLLLVSFITDWTMKKNFDSKLDLNRKSIEDFHYLQLIYQTNINIGLLDNNYITVNNGGFKKMGKILYDANFYFLQTLDIDNKENLLVDLSCEYNKITDNNTLLKFREYCNNQIGNNTDLFYKQYSNLIKKREVGNNIFLVIYIFGAILLILGEMKKRGS